MCSSENETHYLTFPSLQGNTIGSAFLGSEGDNLDMVPDPREDYPYPGTLSVPRMVAGQFNNMGYHKVLAPFRRIVLEDLWKMMANSNPQHFFTVYLVVSMLLHEIPVTTRDRRRWAYQYNRGVSKEGRQAGKHTNK